MSKLHLFNPDNDLALANGSANFTPPHSAAALRQSGAALPVWYGAPGDMFVGAVNARWYDTMAAAFGLSVEPTVVYVEGSEPAPWGWSAAARRWFSDMGTPDNVLPDKTRIEALRNLSHRSTSVDIARSLYAALPDITGVERMPVIARTVDEAVEAVAEMGRAMLKLPWSNAGRGQQDSVRVPREVLLDRIRGMLNRQGAIAIEPYYERETDFALLFDRGSFVGLSLFTTDTHGGWTGNNLAPDDVIAARLGVDVEAIAAVVGPLVAEKAASYGYDGLAGVDMMVARDSAGRRVVPLVEVNWRNTMGHVAHCLVDRFMAHGTTGRLTVEQSARCPFAPLSASRVAFGRIEGGILDLVPDGGEFRIRLTVD